MSKSRPPPLPQHSSSVPVPSPPSISSSPTPPAHTLYKQKYPIASSASLASPASTPSSSPTPSPSPPALPTASSTTSTNPSTSPLPSRPSSLSGSPGVSLVNHSSVERPTPPYLSQRNSFVFEGDSMDGSYSYVISAPPSSAPSPTLTPHHSQQGSATQPLSLNELSIHPTQSTQVSSSVAPSASASSPSRFVPPPVPAHMRSSPTTVSSSLHTRPESPSPPVPAASLAVRRGSSSSTSSSLASSSANSSSSSHSQSQQDDAKTVEFYLKQAISAKDGSAIQSLLDKANKLHVDAHLIQTAQTVLSQRRTESINTFLFYLRQAIESRNREQLKMSIEKLTPLLADGEAGTDVGQLVDRGRKLLGELDKESAQTVHFYLKQGIQLRNRDVIKQSLEKTPSVPPELLDKDLTTAAQTLLTELDAQHLIKFYLQTAIKQKDDMALETALEQAKKLRMGGDVAEVSEGSRLLVELRTKGKGKSSKKWMTGNGGRVNGDKKGSKAEKFQLFGGPLIEAVRRSNRPIPRLCYQCMQFLRDNGLDEPGLFRVAGNKDAIEAIRHEYEEGDGAEVKLEEVHDVAGVFKLYLRMLPEPLIPYSRYDAFIRVGALKDKSKEAQRNADLRDQVMQLPTENYALLCSLVHFLVEVAAHHGNNKMTPENLAIVFAPNLIRPAEETPNTMLYDMPIAIHLIACFILHVTDIFTQEPQTAVAQPSATPSAAAGIGMAGATASGGGHSSHSSMSMSLSSTLPGPVNVSSGRKVGVQNNTL